MTRSVAGELQALRDASLFRSLRVAGPRQEPQMECGGRGVIAFSSNDYLGFAADPLVTEAFREGIERYGAGSGASRLTCGTMPPHVELEEALAALKGTAAALTFQSGFAAAAGTIPVVVQRGDTVVLDRLCHASLIDGARLSGATLRTFRHNDVDMLDDLLTGIRKRASAESRILIVTESVFSMDGDCAPLAEMAGIRDRHGAVLLVDEAHAFGVLGRGGRGLADELGVADRIDLHMGTLSKAAGLQGGYICGSREWIDLLINRARPFIFSTAPPPALAAAAVRVVRDWIPGEEGEQRRGRLRARIRQFAAALAGRIPAVPRSAIVPLIVGAEDTALEAGRRLLERGFLIPAIRYPTVPRGTARLRVSLTASHTAEQVESLVGALRELSWTPTAP